MSLTRPNINQFAGVLEKNPCRVVATNNINLADPPTVIDGVQLQESDRVLLVAQTNGAQNGVYELKNSRLHRTTDVNDHKEIFSGIEVFIMEGSQHGKTTWKLNRLSEAYMKDQTVLSFFLHDSGEQADVQRFQQKQEQLVSGSNIKTVNGQPILGSGDITISLNHLLPNSNHLPNSVVCYDSSLQSFVSKPFPGISVTQEDHRHHIFYRSIITSASGTTRFETNRSPLSTEGTLLATIPVASTYRAAPGKVISRFFKITGSVNYSGNTNNMNVALCCFNGSSLIGAKTARVHNSNVLQTLAFEFFWSSVGNPLAGEILDFSIRFGNAGANNTWYVNRNNTTTYMGGLSSLSSYVYIDEYISEFDE